MSLRTPRVFAATDELPRSRAAPFSPSRVLISSHRVTLARTYAGVRVKITGLVEPFVLIARVVQCVRNERSRDARRNRCVLIRRFFFGTKSTKNLLDRRHGGRYYKSIQSRINDMSGPAALTRSGGPDFTEKKMSYIYM